jgi:RNA-directed DNA polymerase
MHRRQEWLLRVDLADFFPSINFGRVRGMFLAFPFEYAPAAATLLAQLCCHENQLPQGAPTSPIISNFICRRMDGQLAQLAVRERCYYTRYADDLCFSTDRRTFPKSLGLVDAGRSVAGQSLSEIIEANGFAINEEKTRLMRRTQRQRVTGLVVNKKSNVSREYVRGLRSLLFIWRRHGEEVASKALKRRLPHPNWPAAKPPPDFRLVVRGRVEHVGYVKGWTDPVYLALASSLAEVDSTFRARPAGEIPQDSVRLFTEGDTDTLHMLAAERYFHERGEFLEIRLEPEASGEGRAARGDAALLEHCRALAVSPQRRCCVCLFDRDNPQVLDQAVGAKPWKGYGNGVVAVALVPRPADGREQGLCIEMLYEEAVLVREDDEGRRIFLREEFDDRSGHHIETNGRYTLANVRNRTLVRDDVFEVALASETDEPRSVAMPKRTFATLVNARDAPFEDVTFEGFRPTFDALLEAVREARIELDNTPEADHRTS